MAGPSKIGSPPPPPVAPSSSGVVRGGTSVTESNEPFRRILQDMATALGRIERGQPQRDPQYPGLTERSFGMLPADGQRQILRAVGDQPHLQGKEGIQAGLARFWSLVPPKR